MYERAMAVQLGGMDAAFLSLESSTGYLQAVGVVRLAPDAPRLTWPSSGSTWLPASRASRCSTAGS